MDSVRGRPALCGYDCTVGWSGGRTRQGFASSRIGEGNSERRNRDYFVNLQMPSSLAVGYRSRCQQTRVVTESWAEGELFCARCDSLELERMPDNLPSADLICPQCKAPFQVKAMTGRIGSRVPDGAYTAMLCAVREDRTPNLLLLRYDKATWRVRDLLVIPYFAFPESAIVPRPPLRDTARRAGWVGCNIALDRIALDARIPVVADGRSRSPAEVRADYQRLKPLERLGFSERGWSLDVLNALRQLGESDFTTREAYAIEAEMQRLYPGNRHVRPKIRQQLQVLRDAGILLHLGRGRWCLR